jgi:16S RNA G1207 methylase RsmC
MIDPCFQLLINAAARLSSVSSSSISASTDASSTEAEVRQLWVVDENGAGAEVDIAHALTTNSAPHQCLTNRYDIYQQLCAAGADKQCLSLSDFDFSSWLGDQHKVNSPSSTAAKPNIALYRVSKERPSSHWVINHLAQILPENGVLILSGKKTEGIKSYVEKTTKQLHFTGRAEKHGDNYLAILHKSKPLDNTSKWLEHKNYNQLRPIGAAFSRELMSKPGVYGWDKIDSGSELLATSFLEIEAEQASADKENNDLGIDLGCGYGYLSIALQTAGYKTIYSTDNNPAALAAAEVNLRSAIGYTGRQNLILGDAGDTIETKAQVVLCNPPFHQGFNVDAALTQKFIRNAARLTARNGYSLFVVNSFIPLEKIAKHSFQHCKLRVNNGKFKVIELRHQPVK